MHGSGNLIQTLLGHNLVDQYRLWVFHLVLGSGKRLFAGGTIPSGLKLADHTVSTTGVVIGTYEPAGESVTGSFAPAEQRPQVVGLEGVTGGRYGRRWRARW